MCAVFLVEFVLCSVSNILHFVMCGMCYDWFNVCCTYLLRVICVVYVCVV
jgi:hypothetical protein